MERHNLFVNYIVFAVVFLIPVTGSAGPYSGNPFTLLQPDGTEVPVVIYGDEYYQRVETPEGHTLVRDKETGWICYARLSEDSTELLPSDILYHSRLGLGKSTVTPPDVEFSKKVRLSKNARREKRRRIRYQLQGETTESVFPAPSAGMISSAAPTIFPLVGEESVIGAYVGLTICIDFSDEPGTIPLDSIRALLNEPGYNAHHNNGSVRDYFLDVTGGKVDYRNIVVGYYRARKQKTYYDSRYQSFGTTAQELITEALEWLRDEEEFDFSQLSSYQSPRGTRFRALNILYAGTPDQGWSEGLWPHQGYMYSFTVNNIDARRYQITSLGDALTIGTICHENGHMLFEWPDLYDYGGESAGVGAYCIMAYGGNINPVPPCAYLRDLCGWDAVTDITTIAEGTILSLLPNTNTSFIYRNANNENEMFYIESRRRKGRSATLPDSGFMIWHVDREGSNDFEAGTPREHYLVSLEQADGGFHLESGWNQGRPGDLFRGGYAERFDDDTKPDALWWDGSRSGMSVWNMSYVGDTMSLSIGALSDTYRTVAIASRGNGAVAPSGVVSVADGKPLTVIALPDSGYRTDEIRINDVVTSISDTLRLDAVTEDLTITFEFGLKAALAIVEPSGGDILYAGDTITIRWRVKDASISRIALGFSSDSGATFTPLTESLPSGDTTFSWVVPAVESDACILRISDTDGKPTLLSAIFTILKKPSIRVATDIVRLSVQQGRQFSRDIPVMNDGTGVLSVRVATRASMKKVLINEISIGSDMVVSDGVELWNSGPDVDISGWQLLWEDYRSASMTFVFEEGTVLRSGQTFTFLDGTGTDNDTTVFTGYNLPWRQNDSLQLMIMLLDPEGKGVDFIKTSGVPSQPPPGTTWEGEGLTLCNDFIYRTGTVDSDSPDGWECGAEGTMSLSNKNQQADTLPSIVAVMSGSTVDVQVAGGEDGTLTVSVNGQGRPIGTYPDTIALYHNDPDVASPVYIPFEVNVSPYVGVAVERRTVGKSGLSRTPFSVQKNVVCFDEPVHFSYDPSGNEKAAEIHIYNKTATVVYSAPVRMEHVTFFNREPVRFSWTPRSLDGFSTQGSLLARLVVHYADGAERSFTLLFGVR